MLLDNVVFEGGTPLRLLLLVLSSCTRYCPPTESAISPAAKRNSEPLATRSPDSIRDFDMDDPSARIRSNVAGEEFEPSPNGLNAVSGFESDNAARSAVESTVFRESKRVSSEA